MDKAIRKRLKEQYRSSRPTMGVLTVLNNKNNRIYIKGTINLEALCNSIKFMLKSGQFDIPAFQDDWHSHGEGAFVFQFAQIVPYNEEKKVNYRKVILDAEIDVKMKLEGVLEFY